MLAPNHFPIVNQFLILPPELQIYMFPSHLKLSAKKNVDVDQSLLNISIVMSPSQSGTRHHLENLQNISWGFCFDRNPSTTCHWPTGETGHPVRHFWHHIRADGPFSPSASSPRFPGQLPNKSLEKNNPSHES